MLIATAEYLLQHESMTGDVFNYLCDHGTLPDSSDTSKTDGIMNEIKAEAADLARQTEIAEKTGEIPTDTPSDQGENKE
jgi:hypothetical protein